MASQQPHFLLLPYSELGHINPMLALASQLLRLGCRVTFVKADRVAPPTTPSTPASSQSPPRTAKSTEPAPSRAPAVPQEKLRFVTLPVRNTALCVDVNTMTRHQIFKNTLAGLEERQDLVAAIVEESKAASHPISCIICDFTLWKWARHVASTHRLRSAVFIISSALSFYRHYLYSIGKDEGTEDLLVSQFGMPSGKNDTAYCGLANLKDSSQMASQKRNFFVSLLEGIEEADTMLVNSFKALEAPLLPLIEALRFDVRFVGPCLPEWDKDDVGMANQMAQLAGGNFKEDTTCLTWLDQQEKGSVLFVAFGSEGEIETRQMEEIELGIKQSGHKFLWVVRPNTSASSRLMHGLCQQQQTNDQEKGMFVSWAPQIRVLQHIAIGGFLTHSGWNSTLESLTFGVPMLCFPLINDHAQNANFVHDYLQVGVRLSASEDGLVHREEVARGVQAIMQGRFSQKVTQFQESSQLAIQDAHHILNSYVQSMA